MAFKDIRALIPAMLDAPPWRPRLRNATDIAPGWRRHDRTHLEISIDVPADGLERTWEAWIFLPASFRLSADTYTASHLERDFRSHIRRTVPPLDLGDVNAAIDEIATPAGGAGAATAAFDAKLLACQLREAIARETYAVRLSIESGDATPVDALVDQLQDLASALRDGRLDQVATKSPELAEIIEWVDEHLSRCIESAMVKVATDLSEPAATHWRDRATELAISEARHRASRSAGPVVSQQSSMEELESVERRQHSLKRLTSAVLWLRQDEQDARRNIEHGLHAIAAGIAMTFAVGAAVWYGTPTDATDLWVWGGLAILAYMFKDRVKAALQQRFDTYIDVKYPNRRTIVREPSNEQQLATSVEKIGFVTDTIPDDVAEMRRRLRTDLLTDSVDIESVVCHRKSMEVGASSIRTLDSRFASLTDILRVDISRWLTNTDDPSRTVTLADPESGKLFGSTLPRAYDATILYRYGPTAADAPLSAARVVVSRKGIRRVEELEQIADLQRDP
jgi:hypothetical protein